MGILKALTAAPYFRVSTSDQRIDAQRDACASLCQARGWTALEPYEDIGWSGATARRPGLDRLLLDARRGKFRVIVVQKADRLFRSVHHMVAMLAELEAMHVDFVSVTEAFDTSTPQGKLLFHIIAAFAQFERDLIGERTAAGLAAAKRRGVRLGRKPREIDWQHAEELLAGGTVKATAAALGMPWGTLRRLLRARRKAATAAVATTEQEGI